MKKILSITAFLLLIAAGYSQGKKVNAGLIFSNGLSFMNSDNTNITNTKVGYSFDYGIPIDLAFNKNYIFSTGLNISHLRAGRSNSPAIDSLISQDISSGGTFRVDNNLFDGATESYKFTYVNLPTTFKLKTNDIGYFRYFGEFGFVNSFRVRARINVKGSTFSNETLTKDNELNLRSKFYNASLKVGGGFEYILSDKTSLLVALYFYNGFVNVLDDGPDDKRTVLRNVTLRTGIMF